MGMIVGAVLAGGRSRRFGSDKALALVHGRRLIDRVIADLTLQTDALIVCGRTIDDIICVADRPAPDLGPLGGLCAALAFAQAHGFEWVASVPCDMPSLPEDLVKRLRCADRPGYVRAMPVIGLWPSSLAPTLDLHLATSEDRSMRRWVAIADAVAIDINGLPNINTAADLARLNGSW